MHVLLLFVRARKFLCSFLYSFLPSSCIPSFFLHHGYSFLYFALYYLLLSFLLVLHSFIPLVLSVSFLTMRKAFPSFIPCFLPLFPRLFLSPFLPHSFLCSCIRVLTFLVSFIHVHSFLLFLLGCSFLYSVLYSILFSFLPFLHSFLSFRLHRFNEEGTPVLDFLLPSSTTPPSLFLSLSPPPSTLFYFKSWCPTFTPPTPSPQPLTLTLPLSPPLSSPPPLLSLPQHQNDLFYNSQGPSSPVPLSPTVVVVLQCLKIMMPQSQ